ncbi:predicted protein [Lichtheimia corymbifera JMRC:FSU:9682]|uniref:Uncharacterized protein n=1 Tax=Lichtheimia corymbifera JMRC:FSU:9682 TaxID=1263082 RepID=A0A068S953_9FUNG|nr:predicted protein [Lichtheimia corymbifera JMRC:FSU:9682]
MKPSLLEYTPPHLHGKMADLAVIQYALGIISDHSHITVYLLKVATPQLRRRSIRNVADLMAEPRNTLVVMVNVSPHDT